MATLLNDRNELLFSAATRITGATVSLNAGTATSLVVPKSATAPVPSTITLTAGITGYVTPAYAWSYRFGNTGTFTAITGSTNPITVNSDAAFLTAAGTNTLVQYKVTVTETTSNLGINQSEATISIPILREGQNGVDAINSVQVTLYKRTLTSTAPAVTTAGNSTYTFSTGQVVGQPTGWTQIVPAAVDGPYIWTIQVLAASVGTGYSFANTTWSSPVLFTQSGTSGSSTALIYAYKRSATAPTDNPGIVDYSFTTNTITTATLANSWLKAIPSGTDPLYVTLATASSTGTTDNIAAAEWTSPVVLAQNGINSATVYLYARNNNSVTAPTFPTTGTAIYTFANGALTGTVPTGWTQTIPAESNGSVLWVVQATAAAVTSTASILNTGWGTPRVLAQIGANGTSPLIYNIVSSTPVIVKDSVDAATSGTYSSITIQGRKYDGSTTTNYGWVTVTGNGDTEATTATYVELTALTFTPATTAGKSSYTVKLYNQAAVTGATLLDTQVISVVFKGQSGAAGASAISVILSNEAHVFPAANDGTVTSTSGSGTEIRVYEGATALNYDGIGTANGTWKFTTALTNITTLGSIVDSGTYATVGGHTGVTTASDTASILYTITGKTAAGTAFTLTKNQTFSKSKSGITGTRGSRQLYSNNATYTSTYTYLTNAAGANSYAVKATDLIAAAVSGSIPTTPIQGDTVTFTNGSTYVYTITYNASTLAWEAPGTIIDGNLLVTGSVTSAKINSNGLTIRNNDGTPIFEVGATAADNKLNLPPVINNTPPGWVNTNVSMSSTGVLSGAGGGTVTIGGLGYAGDLNATYGAQSGTNLKDSSGTVIKDDAFRNNLINVDWWKRDAAIPWNLNNEYNRIVSADPSGGGDLGEAGPRGGNDLVWYCQEVNNNGGPGGGWDATISSALDPNKTYRFAVAIKSGNMGAGQAYWGVYGVCDLNTATTNTNPYFAVFPKSSMQTDRWYLFVGYVFPYGSTGNSNNNAGVWDCKTGAKVGAGTNYCHTSTGANTHRAYQYYASQNAHMRFSRPMINMVDGTEPSLREYFEEVAVLNSAVTASSINALSKNSEDILSGTIDINAATNAGIRVSPAGAKLTWNTAGAITGGRGVAITPGGIVGYNGSNTTFVLDGATGNATFSGTLSAASGNFKGEINVGNYAGWAWPAAGTGGAHLGVNGLLMGNPTNGGKYFQIVSGYSDGGNAAIYTNIPAYIEDLQIKTGKIDKGQITASYVSNTTGTYTFVDIDNATSITSLMIMIQAGDPATMTGTTGSGENANNYTYLQPAGATLSIAGVNKTSGFGSITYIETSIPTTTSIRIAAARASGSAGIMKLYVLVGKR